jgi:hypothetical protein
LLKVTLNTISQIKSNPFHGAPEFTPGFWLGPCCSSLVFCVCSHWLLFIFSSHVCLLILFFVLFLIHTLFGISWPSLSYIHIYTGQKTTHKKLLLASESYCTIDVVLFIYQ